jgi:hypothetical protein
MRVLLTRTHANGCDPSNADKNDTKQTKKVIVCSATLHSPEITELAGKICANPQWVDLKVQCTAQRGVVVCAVQCVCLRATSV